MLFRMKLVIVLISLFAGSLAIPQQRSSCRGNGQCADTEVCEDGACTSPCWRACPADVGCVVRNHQARCIFSGNARF